MKTAVINLIHNAKQKGDEVDVNSLAACFQQTVGEILTDKFIAAAKEHGFAKIALAGGVAANSGLRARLTEAAAQNGMEFFVPPLSLCGDNAAMIGAQAFFEFKKGHIADESLNAYATMSLDKVRY